MKTLKIVFSTSKSPVSGLIRKITKSPTSHVFFVFDVGPKELMLEAGFTGIEFNDYKNYAKSHVIVAEHLLAEGADRKQYLYKALEFLDTKYDFGGLFGGLWVIVGRWFKRIWKNPLQNSKALFCSEYVATVLKEAGHPKLQDCIPSEITPKDLLELLKD